MTDITKANIINRWDKLANADLGYMVSPVAAEIRDFFIAMFNGNCGDGAYTTAAVERDSKMASILRGFEVNTGYDYLDGLTIVFSLNLHSVTMDSFMLKEFDDYLMARSHAYSGDPYNWLYRWQKLLAAEGKVGVTGRTETSL